MPIATCACPVRRSKLIVTDVQFAANTTRCSEVGYLRPFSQGSVTGTRTPEARVQQETPHYGADQVRRWD